MQPSTFWRSWRLRFRQLAPGAAALVLTSVAGKSVAGQSLHDGEWVGALHVRAETLYVRMNVVSVPGGVTASVLASLPRPLTVINARAMGSGLELRLAEHADTFDLQGQLSGDMLTGSIAREGARGDFTLVRLASVNPALYDEYSGAYDLAPGRTVFIRRADRLSRRPPFEAERSWLQFVESTGQTRLLFPASQSEFFAGPAYAIPTPTTVRVTFLRGGDGRVTGLRWREGDGAELHAPRSSRYRAEEFRFQNASVTLAGRLLLPSGSGPHPAVVLLPGGPGPSNRNENYFVAADVLASAGVATLAFEKRGAGASTGDWRTASYMDLAGDAIAAVQFLRRRTDINPACVGLLGHSEGGWIAPLAARLSPEVAFVALVGASGLSHPEADIALLEIALRADSLADAERLRALALERAMVEYARTRRGWNETRARLDTIRAAPWLSHSMIATHTGYDFPMTEDHWFWKLYGLDVGYDPVPTLRALRVPLLAVWGQWDPAAPPHLNAPRFESARGGRDADRFRIAVLPRGDHIVWEFPTANTSNFQLVRRFVPGYFELLRSWFSEQGAGCARRAKSRPD